MSNQKLLSISIPTWNRSKLVSELLDELIAQILSGNLSELVEIVVSNNGSEDNTHEVLEKLRNKHSFIAYNRNPVNVGANRNVMKSMQLASAEFLIFLGDDDRVEKQSLLRIIDFLKRHKNIGILIDSSGFKKKIGEGEMDLKELLKNYYWHIGNAGVFIVRSAFVKESLNKYGADFFNQCWSQTQIMILGANEHKNNKIYISNLGIISNSVHQEVTVYNSFYLWRVGYCELFKAINSMEPILDKEITKSAHDHLKKNITRFVVLNILQFSIFIDDKGIRRKTWQHIKENIKIFSIYEQVILVIMIILIRLPIFLTSFFSNLFIFTVKGSAGIKKKNAFVAMEKNKRKKAEELESLAIRKLEFETDNY